MGTWLEGESELSAVFSHQRWKRECNHVMRLPFLVFAAASLHFAFTAQEGSAAPAKPSEPPASQSSTENSESDGKYQPSEGMKLKILFDTAIFDSQSDSSLEDQLSSLCRIWEEAYLKEKGPWGFGLATEVKCLPFDKKVQESAAMPRSVSEWKLYVEKRTVSERPVVQLNMCRVRAIKKESGDAVDFEGPRRCEATQFFPWTDFRFRLLRHRPFVRLLADSLAEQLPFRSLLTKNLIRFDDLKVEPIPEKSTTEVTFIRPPKKLKFVEVSLHPQLSESKSKEFAVKDAIYQVMSKLGAVWIVNADGQGTQTEQFSRNVQSAYVALTRVFQLEKLKVEKEQSNDVIERLRTRPFLDLIFRLDGSVGLPAMSMQSSLGAGASMLLKVNLKYGFELQGKSTTSAFKTGTQIEEKNNPDAASILSKVSLKETEAWLNSAVYRQLPLTQSTTALFGGGVRLGMIAAKGSFDSPEGLPAKTMTLSSRELGLGVSLLAGIPVGNRFEWVNTGLLDVGVANKSYSVRVHSEFAWIGGRLVTPGRIEKPPSFRLGLAGSFASLMRPFTSDDPLRMVQTQVTLNGLHTAFFVERTL
ncbi:MAG: hypothetical protein RIR26_1830 [Pseudomonadota bacterium]